MACVFYGSITLYGCQACDRSVVEFEACLQADHTQYVLFVKDVTVRTMHFCFEKGCTIKMGKPCTEASKTVNPRWFVLHKMNDVVYVDFCTSGA